MLMCNVFAHTLALFDEVSVTCATHWVNRDNERSNEIERISYLSMATSTTIIETLNVMVTGEPTSQIYNRNCVGTSPSTRYSSIYTIRATTSATRGDITPTRINQYESSVTMFFGTRETESILLEHRNPSHRMPHRKTLSRQ